MPEPLDDPMLAALLDSWHRNNIILVNLIGLVPPDGLDARATPTSPSVSQLFTHIHYVRLAFVSEDVPECAAPVPTEEWVPEQDRTRLAQMLNASATTVRDAVTKRVIEARPMDLHYDHPILLLQHMIWHEGYHHGQIKLALKLGGHPIPDDQAGPLTWRVWMNRT